MSLRTLRACSGVSRGSVFAGYFVFVTSLLIGFLLRDEPGVCRVVQRDDCRFAKPLLLSIDQAAVFQLSEDPGGTLSAAVQLLLRLFYGELETDCAVCLYESINL